MGEMTDKLGRTMAQIDGFDTELEAALRDLGLPGVSEIGKAGADLDQMPDIMRMCHLVPRAARHNALRMALAAGADPNEPCPWGALPIDTLYTDGDGDGIALLIAHGAHFADYGWGGVHLAVVNDDVAAFGGQTPSDVDRLGDTPFMLACRLGRARLARKLMPPEGPTEALLVAAQTGDVTVMKGLVGAGGDINWTRTDGQTPLLCAVEQNHAGMVAYLLENGARLDAQVDISVPQMKSAQQPVQLQNAMDLLMARMVGEIPTFTQPIYKTVTSATYGAEVIRLLVGAGADPAQFDAAAFAVAIGADRAPKHKIGRNEFAAQYRVRFGRANPEQVQTPFWMAQIGSCASGGDAKAQIAGAAATTDSPIWSFNRYGRSVTRIADGSWVVIGGTHEDQTDTNFCIYNDVTVVSPAGGIRHFIYPARVFPPTDQHTATHVDDGIWIIGNQGYRQDQVARETAVYWLSLIDFSIHRVRTTGHQPGNIHSHTAVRVDGAIHISGGKTGPDQQPMTESYVLDLCTRVWHAVN